VRQWPDLVGARIAAVTRCDRVENGILYVRVQSAPWRHEMTYMTRDILDTITRKTACTTIRDIVFF
jgi:predicted nucleic acid-binding Zn ribbon protein